MTRSINERQRCLQNSPSYTGSVNKFDCKGSFSWSTICTTSVSTSSSKSGNTVTQKALQVVALVCNKKAMFVTSNSGSSRGSSNGSASQSR